MLWRVTVVIPDSWLNRKLIALYRENQLAGYENDH